MLVQDGAGFDLLRTKYYEYQSASLLKSTHWLIEVQNDSDVLCLVVDRAQELLHANLAQVTKVPSPHPRSTRSSTFSAPLHLHQSSSAIALPRLVLADRLIIAVWIFCLVQLHDRPIASDKSQR